MKEYQSYTTVGTLKYHQMSRRVFAFVVFIACSHMIIMQSESHPFGMTKEEDIPYTLWYDGRCKESNGTNYFFAPEIGYIECNLDSCPLFKTTFYNDAIYCFICCYGKIAG